MTCAEVVENNRKCCRHAGKLQDHSYLEYWLRHEMANSQWKKEKRSGIKFLELLHIIPQDSLENVGLWHLNIKC